MGANPEPKQWIKENQAQTQEIILELDGIKCDQAIERLERAFGSSETDLDALLRHLFDMNDANFNQRYQTFYQQIVPLLELYRIRVGDILTIKAFTRTGYIESVNVPVYGTFQFKGMEDASLAGNLNLMDLVSFRDLYGYLTSEKAEEIKKLKQVAGAESIDRANAEDRLFGARSA